MGVKLSRLNKQNTVGIITTDITIQDKNIINEEEVCAICYDIINNDKKNNLTKLECNHTYHTKCIDNWVVLKKICPLCMQSVSYQPISQNKVITPKETIVTINNNINREQNNRNNIISLYQTRLNILNRLYINIEVILLFMILINIYIVVVSTDIIKNNYNSTVDNIFNNITNVTEINCIQSTNSYNYNCTVQIVFLGMFAFYIFPVHLILLSEKVTKSFVFGIFIVISIITLTLQINKYVDNNKLLNEIHNKVICNSLDGLDCIYNNCDEMLKYSQSYDLAYLVSMIIFGSFIFILLSIAKFINDIENKLKQLERN